MDDYDEAWDAGHRAAMIELAPLTEAIIDALTMFKDIERNRQLPSMQAEQAQYVAMGRQLERLLALSGLRKFIKEEIEGE